MEIVGTRNVSFKGKDGSPVEGTKLYLTGPMEPDRGVGLETEEIFLSTAKKANLSFALEVGIEVEVVYNKYGKVETLKLLSK